MTPLRLPETAHDLVATLRSRGLRVTRQRRAICEVIVGTDGHMTVADLHRLAQKESGSSFDISTVYRTIDVLEAGGWVHHVHLGHGPSVIHLSEGDAHHHLVCDVCGRTEDVPVSDLIPLTDHIGTKFGFVVDGVHFALVGRCVDHEARSPKPGA